MNFFLTKNILFLILLHYTTILTHINIKNKYNYKKYINYFVNYLQTKKDASPKTIYKYKVDLNKLFNYLYANNINEINHS